MYKVSTVWKVAQFNNRDLFSTVEKIKQIDGLDSFRLLEGWSRSTVKIILALEIDGPDSSRIWSKFLNVGNSPREITDGRWSYRQVWRRVSVEQKKSLMVDDRTSIELREV
jgi:hypothetical protein